MAFTFAQLAPEVLARCENRTTDTTRAYSWLTDALLELTADPELRNEFDELEIIGPKFNLTGGKTIAAGAVQEYAFSNLLPSGAYNVNTLDIILWVDYPTNTVTTRLDTTSYQDSDAISRFTGQPVKWYRFADTCGFMPTPDRNYQVQARLYQMHPINDANIGATSVLIGRNWNEVLILMAVEKGMIELLQYEKATKVHNLLYGDPKYPQRIGVISSKKKRREKENWRKQQSLAPVYRSIGRRS